MDDTQLIVNLLEPNNISAECFTSCLAEVATWMTKSCLKLNASKTELLLVGKTPAIWTSAWWPVSLGQLPKPKQKVKNVGVWFDSKLYFEDQIRKVAGKCFGTLKTLRKCIDLIPSKSRKTIVHALITSQLDYGNILYLEATKESIKSLHQVQNAAEKLVLNPPKSSSASAALNPLHWLLVSQRIKFKALCFCHRILHKQGPSNLHLMIQAYIPGRDLRSSESKLARIPKTMKARLGAHAFSFLATKMWNSLPYALRASPSEKEFRSKLKSWLFRNLL